MAASSHGSIAASGAATTWAAANATRFHRVGRFGVGHDVADDTENGSTRPSAWGSFSESMSIGISVRAVQRRRRAAPPSFACQARQVARLSRLRGDSSETYRLRRHGAETAPIML